MPAASPDPRPRRFAATTWRRHLREAERLLGSGLHDQAVQRLEQAIDANGDGYRCILKIAEIHRSRGAWGDAHSALSRAAALLPGSLEPFEIGLEIARESGDRQRIRQACEAIIRIDPRHIAAHSALGTVYAQLGDVDAALRVTNMLLRLDPENYDYHFEKAMLFQHKGEVALAVEELTTALRLNPDGENCGSAIEALEVLDSYQLEHIATLAMEDAVFRVRLERDPVEAVRERGFALSERGRYALIELCSRSLAYLPDPPRTSLYN